MLSDKLSEIVKGFNANPILFIGSGFSRRYAGLPDWEGLLKSISQLIEDDEFVYNKYINKAQELGFTQGLLPKIAELISIDFNNKWYTDKKFRESRSDYTNHVKSGSTPFKAEICAFTEQLINTDADESIQKELSLLKQLGESGLSAVITTNYDCLLEKIFDYDVFIGQDELLFSEIQGVAEIYKIHGSCTNPSSVVICEEDYNRLRQNNAYLAAKILTLFLEHPIVFIGYSISDSDIEAILREIVKCLSVSKLNQLKERMIFVEWNDKEDGDEVSHYSKSFSDSNSIEFTKVKIHDFSILYEALLEKKTKYNPKMLRMLKQDIYELVLTNQPTARMKVVGMDDGRLDDLEVVVGVGIINSLGERGYLALKAIDLYRDAVLNNGSYNPDSIVKYTLPELLKQNSHSLPIYKYLSAMQTEEIPYSVKQEVKMLDEMGYDTYFNNGTIRKNRKRTDISIRNIPWILKEFSTFRQQVSMIVLLSESEIEVDELWKFLSESLRSYENLWYKENSVTVSNFKRLIRIYDYFKYKTAPT